MYSMPLDAKTELHLELLYPAFGLQVRRALTRAEETTGRRIKITEALRSFSRQATLFAQGRTTPGPMVTDAQPGLSVHHYGTACDCAFHGADPYLDGEPTSVRNRLWDLFGAACRGEGLTWGGSNWGGPSDRPHAENLFGLRVGHLRQTFDRGGIAAVWTEFDLARGVEPGTEWRGRTLFDPSKTP